MNPEKKVDLSLQRRKYYSNDCGLLNCPECGAKLKQKNCTIILAVKSDSDEGEFMTNLSGSHFCNNCPVVVFDNEKIEQAAMIGIKNDEDFQYIIAGIVNLEAIPKEKSRMEIGTEENPTPLVPFLPDKNTKTIIADKKPSRNEPCPCGSGKKYKKCCG